MQYLSTWNYFDTTASNLVWLVWINKDYKPCFSEFWTSDLFWEKKNFKKMIFSFKKRQLILFISKLLVFKKTIPQWLVSDFDRSKLLEKAKLMRRNKENVIRFSSEKKKKVFVRVTLRLKIDGCSAQCNCASRLNCAYLRHSISTLHTNV